MIRRYAHVLLISQYWLLRVDIHSKSLESLDHRAPWLYQNIPVLITCSFDIKSMHIQCIFVQHADATLRPLSGHSQWSVCMSKQMEDLHLHIHVHTTIHTYALVLILGSKVIWEKCSAALWKSYQTDLLLGNKIEVNQIWNESGT